MKTKHVRPQELKLQEGRAPVIAGLEFETPWSLFDYAELTPGEIYQPAAERLSENGYLVLEGSAELKAGRFETKVAGPGIILGPVGKEQTLVNIGEEKVRLLHVRVGLEGFKGNPGVRADSVDAAKLKWRDAIHGGAGRIATRHIWNPEDFASSWTFMDHALLGPGGSVGYHYHDALEECFVVLQGCGQMTIADETFAVEPGSVTFQGIREGHGIYNPGPQDLDFLRVAVAQPGEEYTTVDLHDDLSSRRPEEES